MKTTPIENIETVAAVPKKRITRKSLKALGPLDLREQDLDSKFHHRLVLDRLVDRSERLGYEVVKDPDGKIVKRSANYGKETTSTHYTLMRIPNEDFKEIQDLKLQEVDEIEDALSRNSKSLGKDYGLSKNTLDHD